MSRNKDVTDVKKNDSNETNELGLVNSKIKINNEDFNTTKAPVESVDGNSNAGTVKSFKFTGDNWDQNRPFADSQDIKSDRIEGDGDIANKIDKIKSQYEEDSKKIQFAFNTQNKEPTDQEKELKAGQPAQRSSAAPPKKIPSDPVLSANVRFSDYCPISIPFEDELTIFLSTLEEIPIAITCGPDPFLKGDLPVLAYDIGGNLFFRPPHAFTLSEMSAFSPYYNPALSPISSPFLNNIEDLRELSSPYYDPHAQYYYPHTHLYLTSNPDVDLEPMTQESVQWMAGLITRVSHFDPVVPELMTGMLSITAVPEPTTGMLLLGALSGLCLYGAVASRRSYRTGTPLS